jgi:hypothetical protein
VVAAVFADQSTAHAMAKDLATRLSSVERAVSPLRSHLALGLVGLAGGVSVGLLAVHWNWAWSAHSPFRTVIAATVLAMFAGLQLADLLADLGTLRSDDTFAAVEVERAADEAGWTVVVHPRSRAEAHGAAVRLAAAGGRVVRSC